MATLYHWDLPQALEDRGGWTNRDTAYSFAELAAATVARLGDRVPTWTTLNEPWCSAFLGYASGAHAPGRQDPRAAFEAAHHLLLAHGLGASALRAGGAREVSLTLNLTRVTPRDPADPHDRAAATLVDGLQNRIFLDPVLKGGYPADMRELFDRFGAGGRDPRRRPGGHRGADRPARRQLLPAGPGRGAGRRTGRTRATRAARASSTRHRARRSRRWTGRSTRPGWATCWSGSRSTTRARR